jgi:diacylglycerol kinase (ATP)
MPTAILLNDEAGTGSIQKKVRQLVQTTPDGKFDIYLVDDVNAMATILCRIKCGKVYVVGGDGSVNAAIHVIMTYSLDIELGIIPAGTVNDFAAYLGIQVSSKALKSYLYSEQLIHSDLAQINNRYFINVAAVGYVADVGFTVSRNHKRLFGRLAYYVKGTIDAFTRLHELKTYELVIDGSVRRLEALMLVVLNSSSLGGLQNFNPYANLTDGLFELYIIKRVNPARGLMIFFDILMGEHMKNPEIEKIQFRDLKISSQQKLCMDIDGEKGSELPVHIQVLEGQLKLIVPN